MTDNSTSRRVGATRARRSRRRGQRPARNNIKDDPKESTDLSEKEPERFASLRRQLTTFNTQIKAEGPDWWKRLDPDGGKPPRKRTY